MREALTVVLEFLVIFALVFANGFFVAAEFALVKVRSSQLRPMLKTGGWRVKFALKATEHLDAALSATQLGITLASLGLGWLGEPIVAHRIAPLLARFGVSDPQAVSSISFALGFSFITFFHIVLGELAPKSLAIQRPKAVSINAAAPQTPCPTRERSAPAWASASQPQAKSANSADALHARRAHCLGGHHAPMRSCHFPRRSFCNAGSAAGTRPRLSRRPPATSGKFGSAAKAASQCACAASHFSSAASSRARLRCHMPAVGSAAGRTGMPASNISAASGKPIRTARGSREKRPGNRTASIAARARPRVL